MVTQGWSNMETNFIQDSIYTFISPAIAEAWICRKIMVIIDGLVQDCSKSSA